MIDWSVAIFEMAAGLILLIYFGRVYGREYQFDRRGLIQMVIIVGPALIPGLFLLEDLWVDSLSRSLGSIFVGLAFGCLTGVFGLVIGCQESDSRLACFCRRFLRCTRRMA